MRTDQEIISAVFAAMPLSERALLKWLRANPLRFGVPVRNDGAGACDYSIYANDGTAIGLVVYAGGRKLVLHGTDRRSESV